MGLLESRSRPYGNGLYFSRYASKVHHYTHGCGRILFVQVALGKAETVVEFDPEREEINGDSAIVPGINHPVCFKSFPLYFH